MLSLTQIIPDVKGPGQKQQRENNLRKSDNLIILDPNENYLEEIASKEFKEMIVTILKQEMNILQKNKTKK